MKNKSFFPKSKKKRTLKLGGVPFFPPVGPQNPIHHSEFFNNHKKKSPKGPRYISPVNEPQVPLSERPPFTDPEMPPVVNPEVPGRYIYFR